MFGKTFMTNKDEVEEGRKPYKITLLEIGRAYALI